MADENVQIEENKQLETPIDENKVEPTVDENKGEEGENKEAKVETEEQKEAKRLKEEDRQKKQGRLDRRFKNLTDKVKSANSDAASYRDMLRDITGQETPKREDYGTPEEYSDAVAEYRDKIRGPKTQVEMAERKAGEAEAEYDQALVDSWDEKIEIFAEELPDYKEVLAKSKIPMTKEMTKAILRSSVGPKIAYYLGKNPDIHYDILDMSPNEQIQAIGRLESKVQAGRSEVPVVQVDKKKPVPNAPPNGEKPKGDKAPKAKEPGQMSLEEYAKWRKAGGGN